MPWLMGFRNAMYLMLTGDGITGKQAVQQGFANASFAPDVLEEEVLKVAERMTKIPTDVQQICKRSVHRQMDIRGIRAGIRAGTEMQALACFTETTQGFFKKLVEGGVGVPLPTAMKIWRPRYQRLSHASALGHYRSQHSGKQHRPHSDLFCEKTPLVLSLTDQLLHGKCHDLSYWRSPQGP
ncbi:MAG: hypothetical protein CM15mP74_33620 [Halieaceae bacterium]|nr:MAG: hypothetical protein CM15mP74_33620 [Halieaceae bacterium]